MNSPRKSIKLWFWLMPLLALAMIPAAQDPEFPPDLTIQSADEWDFVDDGLLVLRVEVTNIGVSSSASTVLQVFAWDVFEAGVPSLVVEEVATIEVPMPIPPELAGSTQQFEVVVNPGGEVFESDLENNGAITPRIDLPGQPEEPEGELFIDGVSPPEVERGRDYSLEVFGGGFQPGLDLAVEGVEVTNVSFENDGFLIVDVFIPEDGPTGPRRVEVGNPDGRRAGLDGAIVVIGGQEPAPPPEPTRQPVDGPDGLDPRILIAGIIAVGGLGALTIALRALTRPSKRALQKQAQKQEPPDECVPGSRWVRVTEPEISVGPWEVSELTVAMIDTASGAAVRGAEASRKVVSGLKKAVDIRRRRPKAGNRFDKVLQPVTDELAAQIVGWQALDRESHDARLQVSLDGPEVEAQFVSYRCRRRAGRSQWVKEREWSAKVQVADERQAGTVNGPRPGEEQAAYVERTRREVDLRLRELVESLAGG